ncbi:free fatty acid receptor 4-like [Clavelina lepadiformis]|uniref:free fatty acid receptor 4-like n=1 Tax=Clavelina lepadiformis TaxID=159417 RepID=UPI004041E1A7
MASECSYVKIWNGKKNVSVFTWFMALEKLSEIEESVEIALLYVIFISAILVNSSILFITLASKSLRNATRHHYIAALSLEYTGFVCISPILAVSRKAETWNMGSLLCKLSIYLFSIAGSLSTCLLALESYDRYTYIMDFMRHSKKKFEMHHKTKTVLSIIFVITICSIFYIPMLLYFNVYDVVDTNCTNLRNYSNYENKIKICTVSWPTYAASAGWFALTILGAYLLPLTAVALNSLKMVNMIKRVGNKVHTRRFKSPAGKRFAKVQLRVIQVSVVMTVLFILMWTPIFAVLTIIQATDNIMTSTTFFWIFLMTMANTVINPLVYGLMNKKFNKAAKQEVRRLKEWFAIKLNTKKIFPLTHTMKTKSKQHKINRISTIMGASVKVVVTPPDL